MNCSSMSNMYICPYFTLYRHTIFFLHLLLRPASISASVLPLLLVIWIGHFSAQKFAMFSNFFSSLHWHLYHQPVDLESECAKNESDLYESHFDVCPYELRERIYLTFIMHAQRISRYFV